MFYFKAEANNKIGGGHLHRCLALAKKCRKFDLEAEFIFSDSTPDFVKRVADEGFRYHMIRKNQWNNVEVYKRIIPAGSLILFDTDEPEYYGREFNEEFNRNKIKTACYTITGRYEIWCDVVINSNIIALKQEYKTKPGAVTLLGPDYMVFRDEFKSALPGREKKGRKKNLLLSFGNADVSGLTLYVLTRLHGLEDIIDKIMIIIGPLNTESEKIKEIAAATDTIPVTVYENVKDMIRLYQETDIAITSGGMSMWEMSLFEIRQLVIASSPREVSYVDYLDELGYIKKIGNYNQLPDQAECQSIIRQAAADTLNINLKKFRETVNPDGAELLVKRMLAVVQSR